MEKAIKAKRQKLQAFDVINVILMLIVGVITLYPFLNTIAIALNDGKDAMLGGITIWPRKFIWDNLMVILNNEKIYNGFAITVARTIIGTVLGLIVTSMFSYALSKPNLVFQKLYMTLAVITMYFSGGTIPTYILMQNLHLTNNFWVYILPALISTWNVILMLTFFRGLPKELEESARIDGARDFTIFFKVIIPISKPILAVIALYLAVGQWNNWYDAYLYVTEQELKPLQYVLIDIINSSKVTEMLPETASGVANNLVSMQSITSKSLTAATMLVTIGPIIFIYPFIQKYFVKGVMIGSIKG